MCPLTSEMVQLEKLSANIEREREKISINFGLKAIWHFKLCLFSVDLISGFVVADFVTQPNAERNQISINNNVK